MVGFNVLAQIDKILKNAIALRTRNIQGLGMHDGQVSSDVAPISALLAANSALVHLGERIALNMCVQITAWTRMICNGQ